MAMEANSTQAGSGSDRLCCWKDGGGAGASDAVKMMSKNRGERQARRVMAKEKTPRTAEPGAKERF